MGDTDHLTSAGEACVPPDPQKPQPADSCVVAIFGATGDLTARKLMPALYNLKREGLLPDAFAVIGIGRQALDAAAYEQKVRRDLEEFAAHPIDSAAADWLAGRLSYVRGNVDDPATYERLERQITSGSPPGAGVLFYLAVPSDLFGPIVGQLGRAGLTDEPAGAWRRVVIEKPFGDDLRSAHALNQHMLGVLTESQIYRIDHYLGKETVQNILALRFGNGIFEPIWNRRYIDSVQITVAETVGVEQRGDFYEQAGALRDVLQNHVFQLLAVTAMEPPSTFRADAVRDERLKVLRAIRPFTGESAARDIVRGQYAPGTIEGRRVPAYRAEPKVAPDSRIETYVAMRVVVDNWRWANVPFYLRTGKRMADRATEIAIQFKRAPLALFHETPVECTQPNWLVLGIQPRESISIQFQAKIPGPNVQLGAVDMDFCYADYFGQTPNTGYETLLYDCMTGDATLFQRADIVEAGWAVVTPALDMWQTDRGGTPASYAAGTWGPAEAEEMLLRDGRAWRQPFSKSAPRT